MMSGDLRMGSRMWDYLGCEPGTNNTRQQPRQSAFSTRQAHPVSSNASPPIRGSDSDVASTEKREPNADGRSVRGSNDHLRDSIELGGHKGVLALAKVGRDVGGGVFRGVDVFPGRSEIETGREVPAFTRDADHSDYRDKVLTSGFES